MPINTKPILIGCEESGVITTAFRDAGYEAYSCDLLPTRGNPEYHIQGDVMNVIPLRSWSLIILHPDCTSMAVSGNRWYGVNMPYHQNRIDQVEWTIALWSLENPVSVVFKKLPNVHYLQPWQYGHGETKKTGFALYELPPLEPTNIVDGREQRIWKMPPSKNRKRDRSETFSGVAKAIVDQWGQYAA